MLYAGQTFYPTRNASLFAVYKTVTEEVEIIQDTLRQSGVYALVMQGADSYYMASGDVQDKKLKASPCEVEMHADGRYHLLRETVPANARYEVIFDEQTLRITHLATGSDIGHTTTDMANNSEAWTWSMSRNHSLELSFSPSEQYARILLVYRDELNAPFAFMTPNMKPGADYEYLLLFDVMDVPIVSQTEWTCYPFGYDGLRNPIVEHNAQKIIRDGILLIERDGVFYDLQGRIYKD